MRSKNILAITFLCLFLFSAKAKEKPLICIINYPFQVWNGTITKIHVSLFKPDFTPAKGAIVQVDGKRVGIADSNGVCIFSYVPGNDLHLLTATIRGNTGIYRVQKKFQCKMRNARFHLNRLFVYTDRGVYQPGQEILIRCIAWEFKKNYRPLAKAKIKITLEDSRGRIFNGGHLKTDSYGIGNFQLPLPSNMPEGSYILSIFYNKIREKAKIRVRRFVAPVIRIDHNLPRFLTVHQKKLALEVRLSFFAGGIIKKSKLEFAVWNNNRSIFTHQIIESQPGFYQYTMDQASLDEIRRFLVADQSFQIKLTGTDEYGRKDVVTHDLVYSAKPFRTVLETDKSHYNKSEKVRITAKLVDINGRPAKNQSLFLKIESKKLKAKTNSAGIANFTFVMKKPVMIYLYHVDIKEFLASRQIKFPIVAKPMVSKETKPANEMETSITVSFASNYIPVEKVVHVDFTDISGSLVYAGTLPVMKNNRGYFARGKIAAPDWGTMLVTIYCCATKKKKNKVLSVDDVGLITEGQKITFRPEQKLSIRFDNLKPQVRPGEKLKVNIHVENKEDKETCLGVAMVDEAVLSLLDPLEKSPQEHFYSSDLKSIASNGILSWPVIERNWGYPRRDIACNNWGWKNAGKLQGKKSSKIKKKINAELVFVLDTTGSMGGMLGGAKAKIWFIINALSSATPVPNVKIGLVAFRDKTEAYVTQVTDLSDDFDSIFAKLMSFQAAGGGDFPEDVNKALADAVDKISWSNDKNTFKLIYLVGDAPPKMGYGEELYETICLRSLKKNISIHTICCDDDTMAKLHFEAIASKASGRNIVVTLDGGVRIISTDFDRRMVELYDKLLATFVPYGPEANKHKNKLAESEKAIASKMERVITFSSYAKAERIAYQVNTSHEIFTKAGDLVFAYHKNQKIMEKINDSDLSTQMQKLSKKQRVQFLQDKLLEREAIISKIFETNRLRKLKIQDSLEKLKSSKNQSFDSFVLKTLVESAKKRGIELQLEW